MKTISKFIILSAFIINYSCNSQQSKNTSDLKNENLKGRVKTTVEYYDSSENSDGVIIGPKKQIKIYDESGNLIEVKNEIYVEKKIEHVDNEIIERNYLEDNTISLEKKIVQNFDAKNRILKEEIFENSKKRNSYTKILYHYDSNNNLVKEEAFEESGDLNYYKEFTYLNSKLVKEINKYIGPDRPTEIITYNLKDNSSESYMFHNNNPSHHFSKRHTKYNSNNDIVEETILMYYEPNVLGNEQTLYFKYRYDKNSNWITKTEYFKGEINNVIHREIIYFE